MGDDCRAHSVSCDCSLVCCSFMRQNLWLMAKSRIFELKKMLKFLSDFSVFRIKLLLQITC